MNECEYCNGDHKTQEPLNAETETPGVSPILTLITECLALSVLEYPNAHETLYPIKFCPMCGRKLSEAGGKGE